MNELNKELAELLGWKMCKCCNVLYHRDNPTLGENPNFTTDAGKVQLLRLMEGKDGWISYIISKGLAWNFRGTVFINQHYITDTTGKLAKAALEWLG
jgi:hypothetical protein